MSMFYLTSRNRSNLIDELKVLDKNKISKQASLMFSIDTTAGAAVEEVNNHNVELNIK